MGVIRGYGGREGGGGGKDWEEAGERAVGQRGGGGELVSARARRRSAPVVKHDQWSNTI